MLAEKRHDRLAVSAAGPDAARGRAAGAGAAAARGLEARRGVARRRQRRAQGRRARAEAPWRPRRRRLRSQGRHRWAARRRPSLCFRRRGRGQRPGGGVPAPAPRSSWTWSRPGRIAVVSCPKPTGRPASTARSAGRWRPSAISRRGRATSSSPAASGWPRRSSPRRSPRPAARRRGWTRSTSYPPTAIMARRPRTWPKRARARGRLSRRSCDRALRRSCLASSAAPPTGP